MTKEEAIKYLQQLYPNGGHCWLDEQRIEAIGMAVKALQEEPVNEDLEKAAVEAFKQIVDDDKNNFLEIFRAGIKWHKEYMKAKAIEGNVLANGMGEPILHLWDKGKHLIDKKVKVVVIEED